MKIPSHLAYSVLKIPALRRLGAHASAALAAAFVLALAQPAAAQTAFSHTGADQTYVVPAGVTSIQVKLWGAGGGREGGSGAFVSGILAVTPGETLTIIVGGGGIIGPSAGLSASPYGGGGRAVGDSFFGPPGAGGGRSAIRRGSVELVTAGAGGGGYGAGSNPGGGGGLTAGVDPPLFGSTGLAGTQTAGGAKAPNSTTATGGSQFQGGNGHNGPTFPGGPGGGSGYYGGGGGASDSNTGGGGGGSSFIANLTSFVGSNGAIGAAAGSAPGGAADPDYAANIGRGGASSPNAVAGGHGRIVISIPVGSVAPTVTTAVQSAVTATSAALGGNVTADGGATVTERGIVWGTSTAPTTANNKVGNGSGTGTFSATVTGLPAGTLVYVRAYAINSVGTSYGNEISFNTLAPPVPEIVVTGNGSDIGDGSTLPATGNHTDFGNVPVQGVTTERTYTITNIGTAELTFSGSPIVSVSGSSDFTVTQQPTGPVAANGGTTTFKVAFSPSTAATLTATLSFANNDGDENPFNFDIKGSGATLPEPIESPLGDVVSSGDAPGPDGTTSIGKFGTLRRGGFLAENGYVVFPGFLTLGTGSPTPVTAETSTGIWKDGAGTLFLLARSGTTVADVPGARFASLPEVPWITDAGEVSFLGSLLIGSGGVTAANDTGLWSELGGSGLGLLIREDDDMPGLPGVKIAKFASGLYATATTSATTGEAAFSVTYKGANTKTALVRASVNGASTTISEIAREGNTAPGTSAAFSNLAGSYSDPGRMDAQGNFAFAALTTPGSKEGIWYQSLGGALTQAVFAGAPAPGTSGSTFSKLYRPSMGSNGVFAFRAALSATGDNSANTRNDGIWRGSVAGGFTSILRRGDGTSVVSNLPGSAKVGNVWGGWLTNTNLGAWRAWLDTDGNGTSAAPTDVHAIYTDLSGAMQLALRVGDAAPGTTGASFASFDLPVVGGNNQYAFLGTLTGGDTVTANNKGIWKSSANGGALTLILRKGTTMATTEGTKIVTDLDIPGSNGTDRRWEQPVMDSTGRLVIFITFTDGSTSQVLAP